MAESGSPIVAEVYGELKLFLRSLLNSAEQKHWRKFSSLCGQMLREPLENPEDQRAAIRACFIAMPAEVCKQLPEELLCKQDTLLALELGQTANRQVVDAQTLPTFAPNVAVWQGDMSLLRCDAVVNPCNNALLGCFEPTHRCLDNILHAQAGPRLRISCAELLNNLGITMDENGNCRVTKAFALPSAHVFHTVGPCLVEGRSLRKPEAIDRAELKSCYVRCLQHCVGMGLHSIAFCCISTGIFGYPAEEAASIALVTVKEFLGQLPFESRPLVIFNVFKQNDLDIYQKLGPEIFASSTKSGDTDALHSHTGGSNQSTTDDTKE